MSPLLLLVLLLSVLSVTAQESRRVSCRFLLFGTEDSATVTTASDKGAEIICQLSSTSLSAKTDCTAADNKIVFYSPGDHKLAATAVVPAKVTKALLVFVKASGSEQAALPWRVFVIEDSPKNFPDGGAFVANFYNKDIRFVIGEHKGQLRPAGSNGYALPTTRDAFNMAPVSFEFLQGDQWRIANESTLRFLPGIRYLIFAYIDPASGRPRINTYQDFTSAEPPAP